MPSPGLSCAAAFKADSILSIRRNGGTKDQYGGIIDVIYDSRLLDMKSNKVVWRSSTRFVRAGSFRSRSAGRRWRWSSPTR